MSATLSLELTEKIDSIVHRFLRNASVFRGYEPIYQAVKDEVSSEDELIETLKHGNLFIIAAAAETLGTIKSKKSVDALINDVIKRESELINWELALEKALDSLAIIGDKKAIDSIIELHDTYDDEGIKESSKKALELLNGESKVLASNDDNDDSIEINKTDGTQKKSFFKRLFGAKNEINAPELSAFDERKEFLLKHMNGQYPKFTNISDSIKKLYKTTINKNIESIINEILKAEESQSIHNFDINDESTGVYLYVSIFNKRKEAVTSYYENNSLEAGFGYANFFVEHFLNNWPSGNLKYFMHLIVCNPIGSFQIHNCVGDYGGNPRAPRNFIVYPVDILNQKEKQAIFHA